MKSVGCKTLWTSSSWRRARQFVRLKWWRLVQRHISGWLDRRWQARHPFPISLGMGPFSHPESLWRDCAGHEWERIDWPYGRATRRGHSRDRVTRCRNCGAPRCDSYHGDGRPPREDDNAWQGIRCTLERHHREAHDYLSGVRIEVGA